jgi:hypothetical protein
VQLHPNPLSISAHRIRAFCVVEIVINRVQHRADLTPKRLLVRPERARADVPWVLYQVAWLVVWL